MSRDQLGRLANEQAALRRVATLVARGVPPAEVFAAVAGEVGRLLGSDLASMLRFEPDETVTVVAGWSREGGQLPVGTRYPIEEGSLSASMLRTGRPARIDRYADAAGRIAASARQLGIRSSVGCPITVEGRLWGAATVSSKRPEPLPADTEARVAGFTELAATAIANTQARAELAASRARIVQSADETRRRIERDLHDGLQQRRRGADQRRQARPRRGRPVDVRAAHDRLLLSVGDDGVGGADPARGSGLVGLSDRVQALGGTITVHSPTGQGTRLLVDLPVEVDGD